MKSKRFTTFCRDKVSRPKVQSRLLQKHSKSSYIQRLHSVSKPITDKPRLTMHDILFDFLSKYVSLTEDEKNIIISFNTFRTIKKGTILLAEGQNSNDVYFVLKGCIRTYYLIDGVEKTTAFYTEMEGLTPHSVINKAPSKYYISCIEDSILNVSNPEMDIEAFSKFPKIETLCRLLSEELLANQQTKFDEFKTSSPKQRYLNLLQSRPDLIQRVPQHQLASYLGVTPESLSRLRARITEKDRAHVNSSQPASVVENNSFPCSLP